MKATIQFLQLMIITMTTIAVVVSCSIRKQQWDSETTSGLSSITINLPNAQDLTKSFGEKCRSVKFAPAFLATQSVVNDDLCPVILAMFKEVSIKVEQGVCDANVVGTKVDEVRPYDSASLSVRIRKGCNYDLLIQVGAVSDKKVYYSNIESSKDALKLPASAPDQVKIDVGLLPTQLGIDTGFPGGAPISGSGEADVAISASFGSRNQSTPPVNPPPGQQPNPTITPTVTPTPTTTKVAFSEVNAILKAKCIPCHGLGGANPTFVDNEREFSKNIDAKIPYISDGLMPPPNALTSITKAESDLILKYWEQRKQP